MTKDPRPVGRPAPVAETPPPPQAGQAHDRWWWVGPSVWTKRMLNRREQSEPTTKWFRLWDKVIALRSLQSAYWAVWRNDGAPGGDEPRVCGTGSVQSGTRLLLLCLASSKNH
jgi:hypothetical protein